MNKQKIEIKVCGMREDRNILEVAQLQPDYMGFIFYPPSPRYVGTNFSIGANFPSRIKRVGVFVNESTKEILEKAARLALDFVQLHGDESPEQCLELKSKGVGVIKVIPVDDETTFAETKKFGHAVDYFLFDTKGKLYGGNARVFNWDVLSRYDQKVPFFLSGGISPEHIETIMGLKGLNLRAIDVNSGVETRPALKDVEKIKKITAILNSK